MFFVVLLIKSKYFAKKYYNPVLNTFLCYWFHNNNVCAADLEIRIFWNGLVKKNFFFLFQTIFIFYFSKKFLKISQISQENTCAEVSF